MLTCRDPKTGCYPSCFPLLSRAASGALVLNYRPAGVPPTSQTSLRPARHVLRAQQMHLPRWVGG